MRWRPGEECDIAMAQLQEVLCGFPTAGNFVRDHVVQPWGGAAVVAIGEDRGDPQHALGDVERLQTDRDVHQPVHLPVQQGLDGALVTGGVALGVHHHRDEAVGAGDVVGAADDVAVERAHHHLVRHDADHARSLVPKAQGDGVGGVVQVRCGLPDPVLAFLGHVAVPTAVEHQGHRTPRDARPFGDVECCGLALHAGSSGCGSDSCCILPNACEEWFRSTFPAFPSPTLAHIYGLPAERSLTS
ncbi:hypothetical protein AHiyo8_47650 [Arthrobacter sp. Hiyo8]|nr:hypothetical protein AHiyo8_47650 [Arthrobacter sp. Hiyo8]